MPALVPYFGDIAQLVEQTAVNRWVIGSSPIIPAPDFVL